VASFAPPFTRTLPTLLLTTIGLGLLPPPGSEQGG
jgi:hypothetical protein